VTEALIIDGKTHAARLRAAVARQAATLEAAHGVTPGLAAVLVGEDPASEVYVRNKGKAMREAGMNSWEIRLPATTSAGALLERIAALNADEAVDGILVQLPLPTGIDPAPVIETVAPEKDVDGFHPANMGRLVSGAGGLVPCTPLGCLMLLEESFGDLTGARAVVVGRSHIVGKPMALLLMQANCTVTVAHSRTRDLAAVCREAQILVVAVGRPEMVREDWIAPGATVIDVGINRVPGQDGKTRLVGDVAFDEARGVARAITPVPGGVGPMTIACLLRNTLHAACRRRGLPVPAAE